MDLTDLDRFKENAQQVFTIRFLQQNQDDSTAVETSGRQKDAMGRVDWESDNLMLSIIAKDGVSPIVQVSVTADDLSAAEGNFHVPMDLCKRGLPSQLALPLRDGSGGRWGVVTVSLQITTVSVDASKTETETEKGVKSPPPVHQVKVEVTDGNIAVPSGQKRVEPFFDVALSSEVEGDKAKETMGRTAFNPIVSGAPITWKGVDCILAVPEYLLNRSEKMSSVLLTCTDCSTSQLLEIGTARVALPSTFFSKSSPVEQWVPLKPADLARGKTNKENMVKVKITPLHSSQERATPAGLGAILVRLGRVGHSQLGEEEEPLQFAKVSVKGRKAQQQSFDVDQNPASEDGEGGGGGGGDVLFASCSALQTDFGSALQIFNDKSLVSAVAIPGGRPACQLSIELKTMTTGTSYSASLPVNYALRSQPEARGSAALRYLQTPSLEVALTKSKGTQRHTSRLGLDMSFVPYVRGRVLLQHNHLEVLEPSALIKSLTAAEDSFRGVLRFTVVDAAGVFLFSKPFEMARKGGYFTKKVSSNASLSSSVSRRMSGASRILNKFDKPKKAALPGERKGSGVQGRESNNDKGDDDDNLVSLALDTVKALENVMAGGCRLHGPLLPITIDLLQIETSPEEEKSHLVATGYISIASAIFPAVKAASSSSLHASSPSPSAVFASPSYTFQTNLFDPQTRKCVAVLSGDVKFVLNALSPDVIALIDRALGNAIEKGNAGHDASLEMSLKQSFIEADADKSGQISSEEVGTIAQSAVNPFVSSNY